jgi:site-specific recombinase XerD
LRGCLFVDTDLRLAELTNIQLVDIDFDRGIIKVMGKGARERIVHMSQNTEKAIFKYLMKRTDKLPGLWVTQERTPLRYWGVVQMVKKLGQKANLKGVRCSPHTFRHTAATLSLENGALEFEVQAMLGHSTLTMTRRYVSSLNSEKAAEAHKRYSPVAKLNLY